MNIVAFPAEARAAALVRDVAIERGYGALTVAQLIRTFHPAGPLPLRVQVSQHVRMPTESATTPPTAA